MANVIRHKRGTSNPVAGDFSQTAELLVNTSDGGLFTKTDGGSVVEVGKDVSTSSSSDALTVSHSTDTDITMSLYCESQTAKIADSFSDTTTDKKYIYFSSPNSSNDPGYILHETSNSETNEGVLHLVPSDDNAENDYVSIHGTNDADRIRLHTSGLIETANSTDLEFRSASGTIKTPDNIQLESSANLVFYDTNGTFPTAAGAFKWTLNNDSASIYAQQPQSDWIDFFFKITDNAGSTDRFVFWIDDYRGATYDKYPAHFDGSAQYLSVPVDGSGNKDLSNARFKVPFSGDVVIDGSKVWHAGNDGSGSGLDADTLDGQQGSYYAPLASPTFTGTPAAPTASAGTNTTQVATTAFVQAAVEGVVDSAPGALDTLNELAAALGDDANFSTTVTNSIAEKLPKSGGTMTGDLIVTTGASNGVFWGSAGPNITSVGSGDISIQNIDQLRFGSSSAYNWNDWAGIGFNSSTEVLTIGGPASSAFNSNSNPPDITINFDGLSGTNGLTYEGSTIWHAGNDGSGSGLDADTVDGVEATSFLRSDASDSFSGTLTYTGSGIAVDTGGDNIKMGTMTIVGSNGLNGWTTKPGIKLDSTNDFRIHAASGDATLYVDGEIYAGASAGIHKVWHAGNDGSGTGLDADTVDGVHASSFFQANNALSATTGAFSGDVTMSGTGALKVANGTTAQRPTAATGQIRYNTTLGALESYVSGAWQVIANTALDYGLITSASDTTFDYGALS